MGIIKAASHAVGTGLSDQWLEALEPDNMGAQTVFAKGVQLRKGTGENGKGSDNMVTEGSIIHVYPESALEVWLLQPRKYIILIFRRSGG